MSKQPHRRQPGSFNTQERIAEATVTALNEFGDGVVHDQGQFIKIARTVPGDRVRVLVPDASKRYQYGKLLTLTKKSVKRVPPRCQAFTDGCGGCQWLHLDYAEQLHWKARIVRELLKQRCPTPVKVSEAIAMSQPDAFRNKMSLQNVAGKLCFMQEFGDALIIPAECRVETQPNQVVWQHIKNMAIPADITQVHVRSALNGTVGVCLFARQKSAAVVQFAKKLMTEGGPVAGVGVSVRQDWYHLEGVDHLEHQAGGIRFHIPLNGFFQTNYQQADVLLDIVLTQLAATKQDVILDLYCGSGFFTLPLARRARDVYGIESNADSIRTAHKNAELNNISNARFEAADVRTALHQFKTGTVSAILLDPPRAGCDPEVLEEILGIAPARIIYVSCSPESLARDLKILLKERYRAQFCQPIDMFPHSFHVETVATLVRY